MGFSFREADIATLTVDGADYKDWKTVLVYLCRQEAANYYRFTCSEGLPLASSFSEQRIRPGQVCTVTLGGQGAIGGRVITRQVAYTATHHGVEITGKTETFRTVNGAAKVEGGELRNVTFPEMGNKLLQPYGLKLEVKDGISMEKFDRVNCQGQSCWEVLDSHARARNIWLGTSPSEGSTYWASTSAFTEGVGRVEEGVNILEGRETISQEFASGPSESTAQGAPTPQNWGAFHTHMPTGSQDSQLASIVGVPSMFMPLVSHLEVPGMMSAAGMRSGADNTALSPDRIKVEVVVQGWFRGGNGKGGLWSPYDKVVVHSPMLIMDNRELNAKSVTFTQDDRSGTRTTLELTDENVGKPSM